MNKFTKYFTISAAALMLLSVGVAQNNANASRRHYRARVTRNVKRTKRNRKSVKRPAKKVNRKKRGRKVSKRGRRRARKPVKRLKRRQSKRALKPAYQIVPSNRRGNNALRKSGFVDGQILAKMGYSSDFANLIFNKYAPNDKRAKLPNYMNPNASKKQRRLPSYNNVNKDMWVKGIFNLTNPKKNTRNPQVYKYAQKLRGWQLAQRR